MIVAARRVPIILSFLLAIALAAVLAPQPALADDSDVIAGTCGSCAWTLDGGVLTIEPLAGGSGELAPNDVQTDAFWPWHAYRDDITSVYVRNGVKVQGFAGYMFDSCQNLISADLSGLDTSDITDMFHMFYYCKSLESLDLSNWDTSCVTSMRGMFYFCESLESLNLSTWDMSSVTSVNRMFTNCFSLESLDISSWDTSSITDMGSLFSSCTSLESLDLSNWDTSSVTNMLSVFFNCESLASLNISGWDTSSATCMRGMFAGCPLAFLDLSGWDTSCVTDTASMFGGCEFLASLDISSWDMSSVTNTGQMFSGCTSLASLDLSGWDTSSATDMGWMFSGCTSLVSLDLSGWDTSSATDMGFMFASCSSLASLDLSGWDTSSVTDMRHMFANCYSLASLDLSGWDTSSVVDMEGMFSSCLSVSQLKLGEATKLQGLPPSKVNGRKDWYSSAAKRWFYLSQINARGVADTYSKCAAIADVEWSIIEDVVYTGKAQTPKPILTLGDEALVEGTHYELSYEENVKAGTATVSATGVGAGGYAGTASRAFTITKAEIAVPEAKTGLVYTGEPQTGVAETAIYEVKGGAATDAGDHVATVCVRDPSSASWADGTTEDKKVAFTIVRAKVAVPKAKTGLVYTGKSQMGVPTGTGYSAKGNSAANAGSYKATLAADSNHVFPDGKTTATVAWSIAKAKGTVAIKARSSKAVAITTGKSILATKAFKVTKNTSKGKVAYKKVKGNKKIVVKNGKITVKKGLKKGKTYSISVKATSAATANYKAATSKAVTLKIKVK